MLTILFRALSSGSEQHIGLHDQFGVEAIGGCQLDLRLGKRDTGIEPTGPCSFEYVLTSKGWGKAADLAQPFCEPGNLNEHYQWLNEDGKVSLLLSPTGRW